MPSLVTDPVCGMQVDPSTAAASTAHDGATYYFCHPHCLEKFRKDPQRYLQGGPQGMALSLPLRTSSPPLPAEALQYICPMDPEVVSDRPGPCPKCGMALEPRRAVLSSGPDPELRAMMRRLLIGIALGLPVLILAMSEMLFGCRILSPDANLAVQALATSVVVVYCGGPFFARAWTSLGQRSLNMFTLIGLGVGAAYLYSLAAWLAPHWFPPGFAHHGFVEPYFEAATAIIVLVLLGQVLELRARHATGDALRRLIGLAPTTARLVLPDGREEDLPLEMVQVGDVVRVRPGEKLPVDGVVLEGTSSVAEAMLTGEPMPALKEPESKVAAGTLNGQGSLKVRAEKVGAETLLARIVQRVQEAQRSRAPIQRLVDRVAGVFVPAVLLAAVLTFVGWSWSGVEEAPARGLIHAVAVLLIACPCALGLATPMAIVVGVGRGAAAGILFRDAQALEVLPKATVLLVDKTGTLTEGKPRLASLETLGEKWSPEEALRLAASLEQGSEHPVASAVLRAAREKTLSLLPVKGFAAQAGQGVSAMVAGQLALLGSPRYLREQGFDTTSLVEKLDGLRRQGQTVVLLAAGGELAAILGVADQIRSSTQVALHQLSHTGMRVVMVTGDSKVTAQHVAQELGIVEVHGEALPQDKEALVRQYQDQGLVVAMAGDGINDAPALARADVGLAMGTGTDVALETAGVTLVKGELRGVARARILSRGVVRIIRQNLFLAFVYNVLAIPLAALGPLHPVWASLAMSLSSVSVIGNSLRLRWWKLD